MKNALLNNQRGVALVTSLMIMSLLTVIGFSALNNSDIELKISGNERVSAQAFYAAEAGVEMAIAELRAGQLKTPADVWADYDTFGLDANGNAIILSDGTIPLDKNVTYPWTYKVFVNSTDENRAHIVSTGRAGDNNSVRNLLVEVERELGGSAINFGAFGDEKLLIHNTGSVRSYNSADAINPTDRDTDNDETYDSDTLEGDVGSNQLVELKNNAYVSGDVALGASDDVDAVVKANRGVIVLGTESYTLNDQGELELVGKDIGQVDTDVLFRDGDIAQSVASLASLPLSDFTDEFDTVAQPLTAGDYYFKEVNKEKGYLEIDNSSSTTPVNIYVKEDFILGAGDKSGESIGDVEIDSGIVIYTSVGVDELKDSNNNTLTRGGIGANPIYIDSANNVVEENNGDFFISSNDEPAVGQVRAMLTDNSGKLVLNEKQDMVLMDSIYFLNDPDVSSSSSDVVYSGLTLPGGKVNIFVGGNIEFKNSAVLFNYMKDNTNGYTLVDRDGVPVYGAATLLALYKETIGRVSFKNSSNFAGLVYTPNADVTIHNKADIYGAVYGKTIDIKNDGDIWFDTALKDEGGGAEFQGVNIISWREL